MKKDTVKRKGRFRIHPDNWELPDVENSIQDVLYKVQLEYEKTQGKIERSWKKHLRKLETEAYKQVGACFEYVQRDAIVRLRSTGTIRILFPVFTKDELTWEIDLDALVEEFLESTGDYKETRHLQIEMRDKFRYLTALLDEFVKEEVKS